MTIPVNFNNVDELIDRLKRLEKDNSRLKSILEKTDLSDNLKLVESLRFAEEQLQEIQSTGKIGIWEYRMKDKKFWGSDTAFQILDIDAPEDGLLDIKSVKSIIHPDDRIQLGEKFDDLLATKIPFDYILKISTDNSARSRDVRFINLKAKVKGDLGNEILNITGTIQDYTDVKKNERELIKSKEKAEESDRLKSAFLANMSHELRTPMNAIIGFSELLNIGDLPSEKKKEYADIIKNKGSLLLTLIDDIIEVSKFESGHLNIHKSETNLRFLLQELYTQYEQKKKQKGKDAVHLLISIPEEHPEIIYTDPGRLQQVLSNLLSNALKFTEKGKIAFGFQLLDGNKLQFYVRDTGIGISKEQQKDIFNRFRQVEDTTSRHYAGGSGLGLTISKGIVELLGGKIWVESELKKETTFYFTIPYEEAKKQPASEIEDSSQLNISNFNWKNKVILVAEDEEVNYKFLETVLHDTQAQVLHAETGKQVIDLCKSINKIDLILMDIKMPEMNGYEATREVKKLSPDIPVIAQTAFSMKDDLNKSLEAGCDDYISKPIDIKTLLIKINQLLNPKDIQPSPED